MTEATAQNLIIISKMEYLKLKKIEERFGAFWDYFEYLKDIKDARDEVGSGKSVPQEKLFRELGL